MFNAARLGYFVYRDITSSSERRWVARPTGIFDETRATRALLGSPHAARSGWEMAGLEGHTHTHQGGKGKKDGVLRGWSWIEYKGGGAGSVIPHAMARGRWVACRSCFMSRPYLSTSLHLSRLVVNRNRGNDSTIHPQGWGDDEGNDHRHHDRLCFLFVPTIVSSLMLPRATRGGVVSPRATRKMDVLLCMSRAFSQDLRITPEPEPEPDPDPEPSILI